MPFVFLIHDEISIPYILRFISIVMFHYLAAPYMSIEQKKIKILTFEAKKKKLLNKISRGDNGRPFG